MGGTKTALKSSYFYEGSMGPLRRIGEFFQMGVGERGTVKKQSTIEAGRKSLQITYNCNRADLDLTHHFTLKDDQNRELKFDITTSHESITVSRQIKKLFFNQVKEKIEALPENKKEELLNNLAKLKIFIECVKNEQFRVKKSEYFGVFLAKKIGRGAVNLYEFLHKKISNDSKFAQEPTDGTLSANFLRGQGSSVSSYTADLNPGRSDEKDLTNPQGLVDEDEDFGLVQLFLEPRSESTEDVSNLSNQNALDLNPDDDEDPNQIEEIWLNMEPENLSGEETHFSRNSSDAPPNPVENSSTVNDLSSSSTTIVEPDKTKEQRKATTPTAAFTDERETYSEDDITDTSDYTTSVSSASISSLSSSSTITPNPEPQPSLQESVTKCTSYSNAPILSPPKMPSIREAETIKLQRPAQTQKPQTSPSNAKLSQSETKKLDEKTKKLVEKNTENLIKELGTTQEEVDDYITKELNELNIKIDEVAIENQIELADFIPGLEGVLSKEMATIPDVIKYIKLVVISDIKKGDQSSEDFEQQKVQKEEKIEKEILRLCNIIKLQGNDQDLKEAVKEKDLKKIEEFIFKRYGISDEELQEESSLLSGLEKQKEMQLIKLRMVRRALLHEIHGVQGPAANPSLTKTMERTHYDLSIIRAANKAFKKFHYHPESHVEPISAEGYRIYAIPAENSAEKKINIVIEKEGVLGSGAFKVTREASIFHKIPDPQSKNKLVTIKNSALERGEKEADSELRIIKMVQGKPGIAPTHFVVNGKKIADKKGEGSEGEGSVLFLIQDKLSFLYDKRLPVTDFFEYLALSNFSINTVDSDPEKAIRYLKILEGALTGLETMHEKDLVHKDFKPENVLVSEKGEGVITDFGTSAKISDKEDLEEMAGTPYYLSPELIKHELNHKEELGKGMDMWAVGALMYYVSSPGTQRERFALADIYKIPMEDSGSTIYGDLKDPSKEEINIKDIDQLLAEKSERAKAYILNSLEDPKGRAEHETFLSGLDLGSLFFRAECAFIANFLKNQPDVQLPPRKEGLGPISSRHQELMYRCLALDPKNRPTATEVKNEIAALRALAESQA